MLVLFKCKRLTFVTFWVLLLPAFLSVLSFSEENSGPLKMENVEITSAPNPVGSGARALGMGGAFIAVTDATTASWNPGGLI